MSVGGRRRLVKIVGVVIDPRFSIDRLDKGWSVLCRYGVEHLRERAGAVSGYGLNRIIKREAQHP